MRKVHSNELHAKLGHPREYMMRATMKHLHYSVKETLDVCEDCSTSKSKQKLIHKVAEECNLKLGEIIYLDIRS